MEPLNAVVKIALDLATGQSALERSQRLLASLRQVIPCDAATVMRFERDSLIPVVTSGLSPAASGKPYLLRDPYGYVL